MTFIFILILEIFLQMLLEFHVHVALLVGGDSDQIFASEVGNRLGRLDLKFQGDVGWLELDIEVGFPVAAQKLLRAVPVFHLTPTQRGLPRRE